ncbi:ABC transporter ATP-binding protein [Anaerococcus sp. mt242]|uniref:ABC transporter ATP-binding protein n=1 Tax=Anaerococcus sp. mt242 TaxID=2661917 RepID=UPI001933CCF5|nr:ABC transporter ATP-binding protein [Anaerococcus sp. mt242]MBM0045490.1 ABC transporter ATP-binding protein [Anaerococcus sp. mt242]
MLLEVSNLEKIYKTRLSDNKVVALDNVNFSVEEGEYIAIMGESGSGKTTLLNLLALLDRPTKGQIILQGKDLSKIADAEISKFRRDHLGFVFQDFNLLDTLTLKENILLPLILAEENPKTFDKRVDDVAKPLRIDKILNKYPYEVSGGQKQRCAVARALITNPKLLLADEPTGALDSNSSRELMEVFRELNNVGQTIIMVTHSVQAASEAKRVLFIKDGKIFHQLYNSGFSNYEMGEKIANTMQMLQRGDVK